MQLNGGVLTSHAPGPAPIAKPQKKKKSRNSSGVCVSVKRKKIKGTCCKKNEQTPTASHVSHLVRSSRRQGLAMSHV